MAAWIESFKRHFSDKEILNPSYLITVFSDYKSCKICGRFTGYNEDHIAIHAQELTDFNNQRKVEAEKKKQEKRQQREIIPKLEDAEFYTVPCEACGKGIKRSGRRGRPPTKHEECK